MKIIHIETKNLILRDWKQDDISKFVKINADRDVMKFFPKILTNQETINLYNEIKKEINIFGYGLYACELKFNKTFIGFIGFHKTNLPNIIENDFIEISWRLDKNFWNNGFASEGAHACINHGFKNLKFDTIYSFTSKLNIPSQKVMRKINLIYLKDFGHPRVPKNSSLYPHVLHYIKK